MCCPSHLAHIPLISPSRLLTPASLPPPSPTPSAGLRECRECSTGLEALPSSSASAAASAASLAAVPDAERAVALATMPPEERAAVLTAMSTEERAVALAVMPPEERASTLTTMSSSGALAAVSPGARLAISSPISSPGARLAQNRRGILHEAAPVRQAATMAKTVGGAYSEEMDAILRGEVFSEEIDAMLMGSSLDEFGVRSGQRGRVDLLRRPGATQQLQQIGYAELEHEWARATGNSFGSFGAWGASKESSFFGGTGSVSCLHMERNGLLQLRLQKGSNRSVQQPGFQKASGQKRMRLPNLRMGKCTTLELPPRHVLHRPLHPSGALTQRMHHEQMCSRRDLQPVSPRRMNLMPSPSAARVYAARLIIALALALALALA